jgi:glycosyltransferase involved in cell wall biosynthesis
MRVLVYNTDGVNPYATEVAALLAGTGAEVTLVDAANGANRPPDGVRWRRILPDNFGSSSPLRQARALVHGLAALVWASVVRGHVIVVAFSRFPVESLVLAALALLGRPVVTVLHNPVARKDESPLQRRSRRAVLRHAAAVVVHAERLAAQVHPAAGDRLRVCPHPPYRHTAPAPAGAEPAAGGRRWVAFVGALRWDKGVDLLPEILEAVPEPQRAELGLVVCGMGELPPGTWERIEALGYATRDLTAAAPVPQEVLLEVLGAQPLVLAPYVAATQSGSVILALSMGCRVIAFDRGGIPDVLSAEGLVPDGDTRAMGRAIAEHRGGTAILPVPAWADRTADAWQRVVREVVGAATEVR